VTLFIGILVGLLVAATPLIFAALGELIVERAGVLNLGVEGMMVVGAVAAFIAALATGSPIVGLFSGMLAGTAMALLFGVLTQFLLANQVASGLALTIFGLGLSALLGQNFTGKSAPLFPKLTLTQGASIDPIVPAAVGLAVAVAWFLDRTRSGLILKAVGENHDAAHAIGYSVVAVRLAAIGFGGACAGLGGAYLSLVQTPFWVEKMTAGRGWIALALVVFAGWQPLRVLIGAYLFGGISILQLHAQGIGFQIDAQILAMLPYLATIAVVVLISRQSTPAAPMATRGRFQIAAPKCLGKPFHAAR
jgi:general nucleoside transport system permease protein